MTVTEPDLIALSPTVSDGAGSGIVLPESVPDPETDLEWVKLQLPLQQPGVVEAEPRLLLKSG